jgi:GNAT superfamily N-acetyltransferase
MFQSVVLYYLALNDLQEYIYMSNYILEFTQSYVGHGLHSLYCWRSDCLAPAGLLLFNRCGDGSPGPDARIRIDINHIYTLPSSRNQGIGQAMIIHLQNESDVIHTPVASDPTTESMLKSCGFVHDVNSINWIWTKPIKAKLEAGLDVDIQLATLLGWKNIKKKDDSPIALGLPPGGDELKTIPSYSVSKPLSLGLLVELSERINLDYHWWRHNGNYSCGVRSGNEEGAFDESDISPWYPSLSLAICHSLIYYLTLTKTTKSNSKRDSSTLPPSEEKTKPAKTFKPVPKLDLSE